MILFVLLPHLWAAKAGQATTKLGGSNNNFGGKYCEV